MVTGKTGTWGVPVNVRVKLVGLWKNAPSPGLSEKPLDAHPPEEAL
jgi:hypothetical protein